MPNSSIWPIDRTLSGATIPGQIGPGSDSNEGVLRIPQSSSIIEASTSDYLVSYPELSLWSWAILHFCKDAVGVFYSHAWAPFFWVLVRNWKQ